MKETVTSAEYKREGCYDKLCHSWKHPIQSFGEHHSGAAGRKLSIPCREPALMGN